MYSTLAVVILLCIGATSSQPRLVSEYCLDTTCYILYSNSSSTWYDAYEHCINTDQQLVMVNSAEVQRVIEMLTDPQLQGEGSTWISGARSLNNEWRDVTGELYNGLNTAVPPDEDDLCAAYNHDLEDAHAVPCGVVGLDTFKFTTCQQPMINGACEPGWPVISGVCVRTPVNFTGTWLQSQQDCATSGGLLMHTGLNTSQFRQFITNSLRDRFSPYPEFWVGVNRQPWVWVTGRDQNMDVLMQYYHWARNTGSGPESHCMYTNLIDPDRYWADSNCNERYPYFICQNTTEFEPTTQQPSESKSTSGLSQENIIIIAVVCAVVALVVVVIIVVIICRGRKNQKESQDRQYDDIPGRPQYPADTYHSYMKRVETGQAGDRELEPMEHDPYQSAASVRQQNPSKKQQKTDDKQPQYNDVFMVDE